MESRPRIYFSPNHITSHIHSIHKIKEIYLRETKIIKICNIQVWFVPMGSLSVCTIPPLQSSSGNRNLTGTGKLFPVNSK